MEKNFQLQQDSQSKVYEKHLTGGNKLKVGSGGIQVSMLTNNRDVVKLVGSVGSSKEYRAST